MSANWRKSSILEIGGNLRQSRPLVEEITAIPAPSVEEKNLRPDRYISLAKARCQAGYILNGLMLVSGYLTSQLGR